MKILSLYIDKWYIVGAMMDGANKTPLSLSNAENRIWLYFYSNSTTNAVKYSLGYKDKALAKNKGYYADVFDLLPDYKEYHYEIYGARKQMSEIFADAAVFADLRKSFDDAASIPTYLVFSEDIDIVAQRLFIERLESENFKVLQHTFPIERLALEHLVRYRNLAKEDGNVLIVNACNENLRYSIYNAEQGEFRKVSHNCEPGYGIDSRKQALVEEVMQYMQDDTHFLKDQEEWHEEMLYLSQFADSWLKKIDESPETVPVALGNIHFKKQPNNAVAVVVSAANLNNRTKNIIGKLTGKIVDMIKASHLLLPQITNVVFLGDIFSKHTFANYLQKKIGIAVDRVKFFSESVLPEVVAVYDKWDLDAFDAEKKTFVAESRKKYERDRKEYVESLTKGHKEDAVEAENKGQWQDAIDKLKRVLQIDPDDQYSKKRILDIERQIEQERKIREQVDESLQKAHSCLSTNNFANAKQYCENVLHLQPQNAEAMKIKEDAENALRRFDQLETSIQKMKDCLTEGRFFDARKELQMADSLSINDVRLKNLREQIDNGVAALEQQVEDLENAYESAYSAENYQLCIRCCEELLNIDADRVKWTNILKLTKEKQEQEQIYQDNYELARKERLADNWSAVIDYAQKALGIKENSELKEWINEAKKTKTEERKTRIQEEFSSAFVNEKWNMVVELYEEHEFLKNKCSNSTMYHKAKRILKKGEGSKPVVPQIHSTSEVNANPENSQKDKTLKKPKRPLGMRPNVASRPSREVIIGSESEVKARKGTENTSISPAKTDNVLDVRDRIKTNRNKITIKPKR